MKGEKALEDYLETIYELSSEGPVTVSRVSEALEVSRSAVSQMLTRLKQEGLVNQPSYGEVTLTSEGEDRGRKVSKKHKLLVEFLTYLGVSESVAEQDACSMEHVLQEETIKRLVEFIQGVKWKPKSSR